jgi:hypothetical protein
MTYRRIVMMHMMEPLIIRSRSSHADLKVTEPNAKSVAAEEVVFVVTTA